MQLESRTIDRAGTLAYGVAGEGTPVVLLHGWPETGHCWRDVWPTLVAAGRRVVVPDLRGVGASDRSPGADYSWRGYAEDLDAILTAESIDRCTLVGHDMGGVVMFEWALRNRDRVESVAAISTSFNRYDLRTSYYLSILRMPVLGGLFLRAATGSRTAFRKTLLRSSVNTSVWADEVIDEYWTGAGSAESRHAILAGYREFSRNRRRRSQELADISLECPALVIWGTEEWALGDDGWQRIVADLPQARVEILEAGHFVVEEQTLRVTELLTELLRETS
jgi:pimeloyl-ACP methyl ester carboxylesterase